MQAIMRMFPLAAALIVFGCSGTELDSVDAGTPSDSGGFDVGSTTDGGSNTDSGVSTDSGSSDSGANTGACGDWQAEGFAEVSHTKDGELDYDQVFAEGVVQQLDIVICPADWVIMQDDLTALAQTASGRDFPDEKPVYVPVLVRYEGRTWPWVGMRFKGNSTLWSVFRQGNGKLPFRLHFDKYEDDHAEIDNQRFFGFKELKFGNNFNDNSLIRDKMMSETLRESGVAAAKGTFARVTIDVGEGPVYWGLYTMFEDPTNALLDSWFGSDDGNMYEGDGDAANLASFDIASFEPKTNKDTADGSEVQALVDALASTQNGEAWRTELEQTLDVYGYLRTLALNQIIGNWDTYGVMTHNYYLYADPALGGPLVYVPWDFNESYAHGGGGGGPGGGGGRQALSVNLSEVSSDWPLIRRTMDDPVYRANYLDELASLMATTLDVDAQTAKAQAYHDLIAPHVVGSTGEVPGYTHLRSDADFENSVAAVVNAVVDGHQEAAVLIP